MTTDKAKQALAQIRAGFEALGFKAAKPLPPPQFLANFQFRGDEIEAPGDGGFFGAQLYWPAAGIRAVCAEFHLCSRHRDGKWMRVDQAGEEPTDAKLQRHLRELRVLHPEAGAQAAFDSFDRVEARLGALAAIRGGLEALGFPVVDHAAEPQGSNPLVRSFAAFAVQSEGREWLRVSLRRERAWAQYRLIARVEMPIPDGADSSTGGELWSAISVMIPPAKVAPADCV